MINYTETKLADMLGSRNWDDHTENADLQELIGGWTIEGVHILQNERHFTTDCILILREPNGKYRALNISNPTKSRRGPKHSCAGYLRIELERLPGEPELMRPRELFRTLETRQKSGNMTEEEREAWYSEGHITHTEFSRLEDVEEIQRYKPVLKELAAAGLWEDFFFIAGGACGALYYALSLATEHADEIEPELFRDFVIMCLRDMEEDAPEIREALAKLPKDGAKDLPEEYDGEEITVYKVVTRKITALSAFNLGELPSWTLDKEEAVRRYESFQGGRNFDGRLYRGKIRRGDIIAVDLPDDIAQLNSVYDITLIGDGESLDLDDEEEG